MQRMVGNGALLLEAMLVAACSMSASTRTAPIQIAEPAAGLATHPVTAIRLRFGSRFDPNALTALRFDNFEFRPGDLCPSPKANGTSIVGFGISIGGKLHCRPHNVYFWPGAVRGMPHWHMLSVAYDCRRQCLMTRRFKPPYLVLAPAATEDTSKSVSFGTLSVHRSGHREPAIYAEQVAVQQPAPHHGILVTLSDSTHDAQICARKLACGQAAASVTIRGGSKTALFYLSPVPNTGRAGKHSFTIAAVADGCEMGTGDGTIWYRR